jgi:hypothetical protein
MWQPPICTIFRGLQPYIDVASAQIKEGGRSIAVTGKKKAVNWDFHITGRNRSRGLHQKGEK